MPESERNVRILYTNHRGETRIRHILPERLYFGCTDWHPEPQWLLDAFDIDKNALRSFAMKDIQTWSVD